jgi:long-chain fatty acid transport protein
MQFAMSGRFSMKLMMQTFTVLASVAALTFPMTANAGNIGISEFDSIESGRGYAAAALANSPSAVFYNPANMTRLSGLQLNLGMTALMPRWEYVPLDGAAGATKSETSVVPPPSFSLTYNLGDGGFGDLAAGVGFYVPYGSTFSWPSDWVGRQEIQKISLQIFEVIPALAWRPHDMVSIGAGLRIIPANVYIKQAVNFGTVDNKPIDGEVEMAGSGTGIGASAGVTLLPTDGLAVALTWRGPATVKMTGASDFDFPPPFDTQARDRDVETKVPLAQVLRLGLAYDVAPKTFNLSADLEYQMWDTYKNLTITFIDDAGAREDVVQKRNAKNSWVLHVGGEYRPSESLAVRAGYVFDQKVLPEATVNPAPPNSDLHVVTLGASYYYKQFGIHGHFENIFFAPRESRTSDFPAKWRGGWGNGTMAYIFGLSVSAAFDVGPAMGTAPAKAETSAEEPAPVLPKAEVSPAVIEPIPGAATPGTP